MTVPIMGVVWPISTDSSTPTIITYSLAEDRIESTLKKQYADYPLMTTTLTAAQASAFEQAVKTWEKVTGVDFVLVGDSPLVQLRVGLGSFDGLGGVLGATTVWNTSTTVSRAALAFDATDMASASTALTTPPAGTTSFYEIALHELGHVLGLDHANVVGDLMSPHANGVVSLSKDDILAVDSLYGAPKTISVPILNQTAYETEIQKCYIAYYGRPADPAGISFWSGQLAANHGDLNAVVNSFANSAESLKLYGPLSTEAVVTTLYQQLFSRGPDSQGLAYWVNCLNNGTVSRQSLMLQMVNGAQGEDLTVINNKIAAASLFTNSSISGYGVEDIQDVRTWLSGVTTDSPYEAQVTAAINAMGINLPSPLSLSATAAIG